MQRTVIVLSPLPHCYTLLGLGSKEGLPGRWWHKPLATNTANYQPSQGCCCRGWAVLHARCACQLPPLALALQEMTHLELLLAFPFVRNAMHGKVTGTRRFSVYTATTNQLFFVLAPCLVQPRICNRRTHQCHSCCCSVRHGWWEASAILLAESYTAEEGFMTDLSSK